MGDASPKSTNDALYSPRGLIAKREATRDPIFLFQYRTFVMSEAANPESCGFKWDGDFWSDGDKPVSDQSMVDHGWFVPVWKTERVFGTREESDAYGERRSYDYPNGWRTYSVCAEGKLAELLIKHWE